MTTLLACWAVVLTLSHVVLLLRLRSLSDRISLLCTKLISVRRAVILLMPSGQINDHDHR